MDLTDVQWDLLSPNFESAYKGTGRPRQDSRAVLNGILWILRTGAPYKDLPERYPPYQTCHRRFQEWIDKGIFDIALLVFQSPSIRNRLAPTE